MNTYSEEPVNRDQRKRFLVSGYLDTGVPEKPIRFMVEATFFLLDHGTNIPSLITLSVSRNL